MLQSPGSEREGQVLQLVTMGMLPEEYLHFHIAMPKTGVAFLSSANQAPGSGDLVFPNLHLSRNKVLAQLNTCHRREERGGICCDA